MQNTRVISMNLKTLGFIHLSYKGGVLDGGYVTPK